MSRVCPSEQMRLVGSELCWKSTNAFLSSSWSVLNFKIPVSSFNQHEMSLAYRFCSSCSACWSRATFCSQTSSARSTWPVAPLPAACARSPSLVLGLGYPAWWGGLCLLQNSCRTPLKLINGAKLLSPTSVAKKQLFQSDCRRYLKSWLERGTNTPNATTTINHKYRLGSLTLLNSASLCTWLRIVILPRPILHRKLSAAFQVTSVWTFISEYSSRRNRGVWLVDMQVSRREDRRS